MSTVMPTPPPSHGGILGISGVGSAMEILELTADKIHDDKKLFCLATNNKKYLNSTTFFNILFTLTLFD